MRRENQSPEMNSEIKDGAPIYRIPVAQALCLLIILAVLGAAVSAAKAPFAFGAAGDHALFHAFGHWIASGDVFIRDFIHFRTPGPYYYYGLVQTILGQTYFATSFALLSEAHIGQALASFFLALAASRVFWGRASLLLAFLTGLMFVAFPPIYQFRTAVPALTLAVYLFTLYKRDKTQLEQPSALFGTGCLLGLTYWFGQEIFVFLALAITVAEFSAFNVKSAKLLAQRAMWLALGSLLLILPGIIYFAFAGVDLGEYFYITLYYAFFIQPKGMDTPFPPLALANLVFYLWLGVYVASAAIFALRGKLFTPAAIVFFSYVGLRLISMLGRADVLHLLFSISELFILMPIAVLVLWRRENVVNHVVPAIAVLVIFTAVLWVGIHGKSSILLLIPFVLLGLSYLQKKRNTEDLTTGGRYTSNPHSNFTSMASLLGAALVIIFTYPFSFDSPSASFHAFKRNADDTLLGVQVAGARKAEQEAVQKIIADRNVTSILSYPVRAEFYSFAPHHGTRYVEFAPQTTAADVKDAIADMKKNAPGLIVKDLDQASSLSPILHELSNYISSAYVPLTILQINTHLEILIPRDQYQSTARFFDNAYTFNQDRTQVTAGMRTYSDGHTTVVVAINREIGTFKFTMPSAEFVEARIYPEPGAASTGVVEIIRDEESVEQTISVRDGLTKISIPQGDGPITIRLRSGEPGKAVLWDDPKIVGVQTR